MDRPPAAATVRRRNSGPRRSVRDSPGAITDGEQHTHSTPHAAVVGRSADTPAEAEVQPLHVIDGHQHRRSLGQNAHHIEHSQPNRMHIRRCDLTRLDQQQRHLQSMPPRPNAATPARHRAPAPTTPTDPRTTAMPQPPPRDTSTPTRRPGAPLSTAALHKLVLPIPASPPNTSADGPRTTPATNSSITASSTSRPTTPWACTPSIHTRSLPLTHPEASQISLTGVEQVPNVSDSTASTSRSCAPPSLSFTPSIAASYRKQHRSVHPRAHCRRCSSPLETSTDQILWPLSSLRLVDWSRREETTMDVNELMQQTRYTLTVSRLFGEAYEPTEPWSFPGCGPRRWRRAATR